MSSHLRLLSAFLAVSVLFTSLAPTTHAVVTNGMPAIDVIGQMTSGYTIPTFDQGGRNSGPGDRGLRLSHGNPVAIDTIHHRLFVADGQNNRVLVYNLDTNDQPLDYFADFVLGQPNFLTDTSGVTSSTMSSPMSPVYDSVNNRLYVADSNNSRILIFDVATIVNGENAVNVLGQPNFTTNTFSVAQNTTPQPLGIALDPMNNRLFVTAFTTNRVTVFDVTTITNGENAVNVLGQVNFTASTNATTASTLSRPRSVAHDSTNNRLFVADSDNNRVLVYNTTTITNGMSAVNVLGQANLNTRTNGLPGSDPSTIPDASGLSYDAVNNRLFVTTPTLNQVRVFDTTTITNGMASIAEVGSPAYGNVTQGLTQNIVANPTGVSFDGAHNRIYVTDTNNNRIMVFDTATVTNGEPAVDVLGQLTSSGTKSYTQGGPNSGPNEYGFENPVAIALDSVNHRLFVGDMQNRRILIYNLTSGNILADRIPDFVLGASDFVTPGVITSPTPSNFLPLALAYDSVNNRLFVGDNQSRVLVFDTTTITNGMNAVNVLGKPDFVTGGVPTATQSSIYTPYGLAYHPVTNRLFVLDGSLNRVLVFDTTTITDGENAVNVLGQPNFTSSATATNQAGMNFPMGIALDSANNRLFVTEPSNNRTTVFDVTTITDGENAVNVLGQPNFTTSTSVVSQSSTVQSYAVAYDSNNNRLFVSDNALGTIKIFDTTTIINGENAVNVLGATTFTGGGVPGATQSTIRQYGRGATYDTTNDRLYFGDMQNHRIVVYDLGLNGIILSTSTGSLTESGASTSYTVHLSSPPSSDVTLSFSSSLLIPSPSTLTFTSGSWNVPQTVIISAPDDNVVRGGIYTGTLTHLTTSAFAGYSSKTWDVYTASVTDNDTPSFTLSQTGMILAENGGTGIFTVVLDTAPIADIVLTPSSNTGHVTTSPASLTFTTANWNIPQTFAITGVDDFSDTLFDDTGSIVVSVNTGLSNVYWSGTLSRSLLVTATDDDIASYILSATGVAATEGGATGSYTLRLTTLPESPVTITLTGGSEVTPSPNTIIFTGGNWNIPQTITVTAVDDLKIEGTHTGTILHTLSSFAFGYSGMILSGVAVDVTDNDAPSVIISQNIFTGVTDSGGTVVPTIRLGAQPASDVVLTLISANPLKLTLSTTGMTFTTANWSTPQPLVLTAQTDTDTLYDTTFVTVRVLTGSSDASYSGVTSQTISVSVLDTDDTDSDGVKDSIENAGPNGGDANGDGILDSIQQSVATVQNPINFSYATLTASGGGCNFIDQPQIIPESSFSRIDSAYDYPLGLARFRLQCTTTGATTQVDILYPGIYTTSIWTYRKYYTPTTTYTNLTSTGMFSTGTVGSGVVTKVSFSLTDGSLATDEDGLADRYIQDPSGPSILTPVSIPTTEGGGGGAGSSSSSVASTHSTPVMTPHIATTYTPITTTTTPSIQFLATQSFATPTGQKNIDGYERYTIENRITDVVCPEIVKVFDKDKILANDIPSNFTDDINAVLMFRGIEKDEKWTSDITFQEYKGWGVSINDESYESSRNITRAEYVKMLVRALSCRYEFEGKTTLFSDVSPDMWYAEYINYAVNHKWLSGYTDGTFRPNNPITRGEAAKILANAIELQTGNISLSSFEDVRENSSFISYIESLKVNNVIGGKTKTTFEPDSNITRAETAKIIYRTFLGGSR